MELFALAVTFLVMLPAALWVTASTEGRDGVLSLLAGVFRWRCGARWWAVVVLALPVTTAVLALAAGGSLSTADVVSVSIRGVVMALTAVLVIHLWEETVWTGFVQRRLERQHTLFTAALITAVPFAGIHLPLLLIGDFTWPSLLADVAGLAGLAAAFRLLVGVFLRVTDSVLAISVLHAVFNASNNNGGLVDGLLDGGNHDATAVAAIALVTAVVAMAERIRARKRIPSRPTPWTEGGSADWSNRVAGCVEQPAMSDTDMCRNTDNRLLTHLGR
jgi:membrane protease YdiL (CAAX protease family)